MFILLIFKLNFSLSLLILQNYYTKFTINWKNKCFYIIYINKFLGYFTCILLVINLELLIIIIIN